jgi:hypothetical protein
VPSSSPLITRPTYRPPWPSGARYAASGTTICATTDVKPRITEHTRKNGRLMPGSAGTGGFRVLMAVLCLLPFEGVVA